jgi:hypothetical protein
MRRKRISMLLFSACLLAQGPAAAQTKDSLARDTSRIITDTLRKKQHDPRKATIKSAIIPGWGQIYNGKYWKVPLVYAAIGIPAYTFFYNKKWYDRTRMAAKMISSTPPDTANYKSRVNEQLWVFFNRPNTLPSLLNYRNQYRRDMDYSILITLLMWGLNVVDATVDGHLKEFDIGNDLSLKIKPSLLQGQSAAGISLSLSFKNNRPKPPLSTLPY